MPEEPARWNAKHSSQDALVGVLVTVVVGAVMTPFSDRLGAYPDGPLIAAGGIFAAALAMQLAYTRERRPRSPAGWVLVLVPFAVAAFVFWGLTVLEQYDGPSRSAAPIYLALAGLAVCQLSLLSALFRRWATQLPPRVGLASTAVLIEPGANPQFVLVLNRNLNGDKGLWVPPGGHFHLDEQIDPAARALQKIETEIGLRAAIWYASNTPRPELSDLNTAETRWLTPPTFLLDEDLLGTCSLQHERHTDFVYICVVLEGQPHAHPRELRYPPEFQLRLDVDGCVAGEEHALTTLRGAVEAWESQRGEQRSRSETVARDVAQRLHFAAVAYTADQRRP